MICRKLVGYLGFGIWIDAVIVGLFPLVRIDKEVITVDDFNYGNGFDNLYLPNPLLYFVWNYFEAEKCINTSHHRRDFSLCEKVKVHHHLATPFGVIKLRLNRF